MPRLPQRGLGATAPARRPGRHCPSAPARTAPVQPDGTATGAAGRHREVGDLVVALLLAQHRAEQVDVVAEGRHAQVPAHVLRQVVREQLRARAALAAAAAAAGSAGAAGRATGAGRRGRAPLLPVLTG